MNKQIERSSEFNYAINLLDAGQSFILMGEAGTGKTTLLHEAGHNIVWEENHEDTV